MIDWYVNDIYWDGRGGLLGCILGDRCRFFDTTVQ